MNIENHIYNFIFFLINNMETQIIIQIPYWIVFLNDRIVDNLWLNPYLLNEWLRDTDDLCSIEITQDNLWILERVTNYLHRNFDNDND